MAWSPLAGGLLFDAENKTAFDALERIGAEQGVDAATAAVAWLLAHPARIIPVLGTNNLSRIAQIGRAMDVTLDRETWFELYEAANGQEVP